MELRFYGQTILWTSGFSDCSKKSITHTHTQKLKHLRIPWWTFRLFLIFFSSGRGKGESEAPGAGESLFLLKIPAEGGSSGGGGPRGRCLRRIGEWGGGGQIFFGGAEMSIKIHLKVTQKVTQRNGLGIHCVITTAAGRRGVFKKSVS